jgi:inhibitor of KinA
MKLEPLGDSAVVATLGSKIDAGTLASVLKYSEVVVAAKGRGIVDVVPAYATVTVFYDPHQFAEPGEDAYESVCRFMEACIPHPRGGRSLAAPRTLEIPVCYGGEFGPDLERVAEGARMAAGEASALHTRAKYLVHAIGFTPGFPYLGGLPNRLHTPRRDTPRTRVAAGSVGIGGAQTGVYPLASPGGWQIIGRTPLALFRPSLQPAALLRLGDHVRFTSISASEFETWK